MLLLAACTQTTDEAETSAASSSGTFLFYTATDGLYRAELDGSEKTLLKSSAYLRYIGSLDGWVYFTDEGSRLWKTDADGQREEALTREPVLDAIMVNGTLYYIQAGKLFCLDADDQLRPLAEMPQDILELPFNLKTDEAGLFICTYAEQGFCSVYGCDLSTGKIDLLAANIHDNPFVLYEDQAIQVSDAGTDNQIFKQSLATGEKQVLLSYTGVLYDMCEYGDWLLYITQPTEGSRKYMDGFNLRSCDTFRLESPGDYFYQTLENQILIMNSEDQSLSRFVINGDQPSFGAFNEGV